jgi:hypothetical protein
MDAAADDTRTHLLGLERPALEAFVASLGSKPFRARQLMQWMYKRVEGDFASMTDLARDFRAQLTEHAVISAPEVVSRHDSVDGTRKWLLRADGTQAFEMVYIPETDRGTLCVSSQVGCALDGAARFQPQPHHRRDRRSGLARQPRTRPRARRVEAGDQCRADGHGRAARQLP